VRIPKPHAKSSGIKKDAKRQQTRKVTRSPRTAADFNALPEKSKDAYDRMIKVIARMKKDKTLSLRQASRPSAYDPDEQEAIDPRTVLRLGGSALKKVNGRYVVKQQDNLLRMLKVPTPDGVRAIGIRGFHQASMLGKYWASVQRYLRTGDASGLSNFWDRQIKDASGVTLSLITDVRVLKDLARAGTFSFETMYVHRA
jgi:hypothetical protein